MKTGLRITENGRVRGELVINRNEVIKRIGLLVLSNDFRVERDLMDMRQNNSVALHVNRVPFNPPISTESLKAIETHLHESARQLTSGRALDAIIFACTSATAFIGEKNVAAAVSRHQKDVPCVTPTQAGVSALRHLGCRKVAVLTPYTSEIGAQVKDVLVASDIEVVRFANFELSSPADIQGLSPTSISSAAIQLDRDDVEAIFISCTAIPAATTIQKIEDELGKPVLCSNTAMWWHALSIVGDFTPVRGYGRLLLRGFQGLDQKS